MAYLAVLAAIAVASLWLEVVVQTRVLRRLRRLVLSVLPVLAAFTCWDWYAVAHDHWGFDPRRVSGVVLPGGLPIEEVLFLVVVPLATILTFEAVRGVKGWPVDDGDAEAAHDPASERGARP